MLVGIVLDKWKLPIFKRILNREGFEYTQHSGVTADTITLKVNAESAGVVRPFIIEANEEAKRNKMN